MYYILNYFKTMGLKLEQPDYIVLTFNPHWRAAFEQGDVEIAGPTDRPLLLINQNVCPK